MFSFFVIRHDQNIQTLKKSGKWISTVLLGVGLSSLLTGCEGLNSGFTCPLKPGVSCQSLDQVNTLVDQGKIAQVSTSQKTVQKIVIAEGGDSKNIHRASETVMRLWIAPYQDTHGNYFSASVVYHVIQPGHWVGESESPSQSVAHHV